MIDINACGIYKITNRKIGRVYIGSTKDAFEKRWNSHKADLRRGKHANHFLQSDWNLYGPAWFSFEVVEYLHKEESGRIYEVEEYWNSKYEDTYNIAAFNQKEERDVDGVFVEVIKYSIEHAWYRYDVGNKFLVGLSPSKSGYKVIGKNQWIRISDCRVLQ
jgi:group I intron endonuclease